MPYATFNGAAIFGDAIVMNHDDPENANQINHYPGTVGVERLDLGEAESYTIVRGVLYADTPDDLGSAIQTIRTLKQNGTPGILIDTEGFSWPVSVIQTLRTNGPSTYAPGWGWIKSFECRIIHLGIDPTGDGEPLPP